MDIHKQAIEICKKNSKGKPNNKSNKKCLKTLFTHRHILNIYLNKLPFVLDLTNKKWWIAFQVQLMNWQLLLFKWCKIPFEDFYENFDARYHPSSAKECKFLEEVSTATVPWICTVQEYLTRIKRWVEIIIL